MRCFKKLLNQIKFDFFVLCGLLVLEWAVLTLVAHYFYFSKFNHYEKSYETYMKKTRQLEQSALQAQKDLERWLKRTNNSCLFNRTNADFCLALMSRNRLNSNVNYLVQSLMSILTRVSLRETNLAVFLINTEPNPIHNKNALSLASLVHTVNISSKVFHSNNRVNEAADYAKVIKLLDRFNCSYQLIVEDDAIAQVDWFTRVKHLTASIPASLAYKWFDIKLFTGYKFFDWDWLSFKYALSKVVLISICLSVLTFYVYSFLIKRYSSISVSKLGVFLILVNSFGLIVVFNTTSVSPIRSGIREYATGFGGVSVLYNRLYSIRFAEYLERVVSDYVSGKSDFFQPKDLLIEEFRRGNNLSEFIAEPSVFQHTGMHSSLYERDLNSVGFEKMFKSFSFLDNDKLIKFDEKFV